MIGLILGAALLQASGQPHPQQAELLARIRCQIAVRILGDKSGVPADLALTVTYARGALLAGNDWPRGTRAMVERLGVSSADIERFEAAEQPRFAAASSTDLMGAMRACNASFGAATQYDTFIEDED